MKISSFMFPIEITIRPKNHIVYFLFCILTVVLLAGAALPWIEWARQPAVTIALLFADWLVVLAWFACIPWLLAADVFAFKRPSRQNEKDAARRSLIIDLHIILLAVISIMAPLSLMIYSKTSVAT